MSKTLCKGNKTEIYFQELPPSLQDSIKNIIKREKISDFDTVVKNLNTDGDNYFGKLYEVDVKGRTNEGEKEINLFIKEKLYWKNKNFLDSDELYGIEAFMYNDVSKVMHSLQDAANVPSGDRFKTARAYDDTNQDAMIFENLCKKGYVRSERHEATTIKLYQLAVEELAKFHALSLVIQERMPKYFKEKIEVLNTPFNFGEDFNALLTTVCTYLASLYENETKVKIEKLQSYIINNFRKHYSNKTSVCTLSHGDFKRNNCMIRLKNGDLTDVLIIDYQLLDCGCPVRDLILMIIFESDREFRKKHLNDLKNLYFEKMTNFLKYFDIDVETVFPRKEFDRLCSEYMKSELIMYFFYSVFFITEHAYDMKKMNLRDLPYLPRKDHEKIIRDLIDDYVEWGYL